MTGRLCYGPEMKDRKGLTQNITLGANILTDWRISGRNNKKKKLGSMQLRKGYSRSHNKPQLQTKRHLYNSWIKLIKDDNNHK